jgi:hypothetical protein
LDEPSQCVSRKAGKRCQKLAGHRGLHAAERWRLIERITWGG